MQRLYCNIHAVIHINNYNNIPKYSLLTVTVCKAKSEGLIRYPTVFGGSVADLQCADNAHSNSSNMTAQCNSTGNWSDDSPHECFCGDGYRVVINNNGEGICES